MHPSALFRIEDQAKLLAHLARHAFVTIAAAPDGKLRLAHTPVVVRRLGTGVALDFHLARVNALSPFLVAGFAAVANGLAAEAYVSPDWYQSADQVPTWNYLSVEAEGRVTALDQTGLIALLDDLSAQEEARLAPKRPWTRGKMSPGRFEGMLKSIVGARLTIERLEGTGKLSQNKTEVDRAGVIANLGDHPIVRFMRDA